MNTDEEKWARVAAAAGANAQWHHATRTVPIEALGVARQEGLLGWQVASGATHVDTLNVIRQLARADASLALTLAMHFLVVGFGQSPAVPEAIRKGIAQLAAQGSIFCAAVSEQHTYSKDIASAQPKLQATPTKDGSGFSLLGSKRFCTGITTADYVLVSCVNTATNQAMMVLVPTNAPGLAIQYGSWRSPGARATLSEGLEFTDVFVPEGMTLVMEPFVPQFLGAGLLSFGYYTAVSAQLLLDLLELAKATGKGDKHHLNRRLEEAEAAMQQLMHAAELHDQQGAPTLEALTELLHAKLAVSKTAEQVCTYLFTTLGLHDLNTFDAPDATGNSAEIVRAWCDLWLAHKMPPHYTECERILREGLPL